MNTRARVMDSVQSLIITRIHVECFSATRTFIFQTAIKSVFIIPIPTEYLHSYIHIYTVISAPE